MYQDTIMLNTVVIYPWPSKEQFAKAFVETEIPNDDYKRAMNNLNREKLNERMQFTPMDGALNFKWQQQQIQNKLYYAGQYAPISLLNPIAWAQFIQAWKEETLKINNEIFYKYNLLFFCLLFSIIIVGQEKIVLKGNIRDINGNPISNANIKVISNELEETTGAASDKNGLFNLSLSNFRTTIVITHVNFKKITKTINPERNSTLNIK